MRKVSSLRPFFIKSHIFARRPLARRRNQTTPSRLRDSVMEISISGQSAPALALAQVPLLGPMSLRGPLWVCLELNRRHTCDMHAVAASVVS